MNSRQIDLLISVTQCLLLLTRIHHSYTTHTVSLLRDRAGVGVGGGEGGGGERGRGEAGERVKWVGVPKTWLRSVC